eukprot:scaffold12189_cov32-Cyclotella_meneghiniana.AAC.7
MVVVVFGMECGRLCVESVGIYCRLDCREVQKWKLSGASWQLAAGSWQLVGAFTTVDLTFGTLGCPPKVMSQAAVFKESVRDT